MKLASVISDQIANLFQKRGEIRPNELIKALEREVAKQKSKDNLVPNTYTIYDYDLQILYKCEGTALIEIDMPPCESDEPESSASVTAAPFTVTAPAVASALETVSVVGSEAWV